MIWFQTIKRKDCFFTLRIHCHKNDMIINLRRALFRIARWKTGGGGWYVGGMSGLRQVSAGDRCVSGDQGLSVHTEACSPANTFSSAIYWILYCSMYNSYTFLLTRTFKDLLTRVKSLWTCKSTYLCKVVIWVLINVGWSRGSRKRDFRNALAPYHAVGVTFVV